MGLVKEGDELSKVSRQANEQREAELQAIAKGQKMNEEEDSDDDLYFAGKKWQIGQDFDVFLYLLYSSLSKIVL